MIHPRRPAPVILKDETFRVDEAGNVVMTPAEFSVVIENKVKLGQFITSLSAIVDYYRKLFPAPKPMPKPDIPVGST